VGATRRSLLNMVVSDGQCAVVSRYATGTSEALSLYLRIGTEYVCEQGVCRMQDEGKNQAAVIVASEPLTEDPGWEPVPRNHMVLIHPDLSIGIREIC